MRPAKTVYLCTPMKCRETALGLIPRLERLGFKVLCPVKDTPQDLPPPGIFKANVGLIEECDIFVAVLDNYGKDLAAETGMAYAWGKTMIGVDYCTDPRDIMVHQAYDEIIREEKLEETLRKYMP